MADNDIKELPEALGQIGPSLKKLYLHGNNFTSFPCSFLQLTNLQEFSLEWFLYARPPKPKVVKRSTADGEATFQSLKDLCKLLVKYKMQECALITFLENYSDNYFNINNVDNR